MTDESSWSPAKRITVTVVGSVIAWFLVTAIVITPIRRRPAWLQRIVDDISKETAANLQKAGWTPPP